ncbi:MAG: hypothetical protein V1717_03220 [Candidatus Micrarchaeota archaeon]
MKAWQLVLALAILLGALLLFQNAIVQAGSPFVYPSADLQAQARSFSNQNSETLLDYKSQDWGFSIRYPVGYEVSSDESFTLKIRSYVEHFAPEVFTLRIEQDFSSEKDLQNAVSALKTQGSEDGFSTAFSGKKFYFLKDTSEEGFVSSFLYSCTAPNATAYTAVLTTFVPASFPEDKATVNFIAHSFDC